MVKQLMIFVEFASASIKAWIVTAVAWALNLILGFDIADFTDIIHLIREIFGVISLLVAIGFTIYQWKKFNKKKE